MALKVRKGGDLLAVAALLAATPAARQPQMQMEQRPFLLHARIMQNRKPLTRHVALSSQRAGQ